MRAGIPAVREECRLCVGVVEHPEHVTYPIFHQAEVARRPGLLLLKARSGPLREIRQHSAGAVSISWV